MDLIEISVGLINEVQGLRKDFRAGKISLETYSKELDGIGQIEKLANVMIKTRITEERFKKPIVKDQKLISMENLGDEKIECPEKSPDQITRNECLDLSGSSDKPEECDGCPEFSATRNLLLGKKLP